MPFVVVYDANALYGNAQRDLLIRIAQSGLVQAKWTEPLIESLQLPDPDDRHVLAAAIKSSAQVIVKTNLRHFPEAELRQWSVEAKSPDDFVLDQINIDARIVYSCVREIANSRRNPLDTVDDVLAELERAGLVQSVAALRLG